jgi:hypothetical protein
LLKRTAKDGHFEWVAFGELNRATLSGPHKRWIAELADKARA